MNGTITENGSTHNNNESQIAKRARFDGAQLVKSHLRQKKAASNLDFNEKVTNMIASGRQVYHFAFGQAPFPIMDEMVQALKEHAHEKAYLEVTGLPELREGIIKFHERHDGLTNLSADNVVVGPGTKELIFLMLLCFDGDVLVVSPAWPTYKPQSEFAHHQPHIIPVYAEDEWRLTPENLEKVIVDKGLTGNKVLIICNPDNPTGTEYRTHHLKALSEMCRKHKMLVISDEIYSRLHYEGKHDTLARYYPEGTILSSGMSKWASAGGWRLGYHIYPSELSDLQTTVLSAASNTYSCAAAPMQYAVAKTLKNEEACDKYILHINRILKVVGHFCHRELTSVGVKAMLPKGTYYMFPDFEIIRKALNRRGINTGEEMCQLMLKEAQIALMAGGPSFLRSAEELTTRLCFVCFDGEPGLRESFKLGIDTPLPDDFIQKYCTNLYDGIMSLKTWILTLLSEKEGTS